MDNELNVQIESLRTDIQALRGDTYKDKEKLFQTAIALDHALKAHLTPRWDFFKTVLSIITFLFGIGAVLQVLKVNEIQKLMEKTEETRTDLIKKTDEARVNLENLSKAFSLQVGAQAKVLGTITEALSNINSGDRDYSKDRYGPAVDAARKAVDALERALKDLKSNPTLVPGLVIIDPATSLEPALNEALLTAYILYASASFWLSDYETVIASGKRMVELKKDRWEGFHFLALGLWETGRNQSGTVSEAVRKDVVRNFEESLRLLNFQ